MPGRAQTGRRATPRTAHGDTTGNAAIQLRQEHANAVREAQQKMSMVGAPPEPYDISDEAEGARQEEAENADPTAGNVDMSQSGLDITALPRPKPRGRGLRSVTRSGEYDPDEPVEIRFNDTYEGVTLGKSNVTGDLRTFDFEVGRPYRVPTWVADHFADKEMLA